MGNAPVAERQLDGTDAPIATRSRWKALLAMVPALGLALAMSHFLRSVPAVIAPDLRADLGLSPSELSLLPAALFVGSAMMQIPVGILLDRYGPRLTIAGFVLATATGTLGFSLAHDPVWLIASLVVAGWGTAPVFMGAIVLLSRWVPRDRLSTATAIAAVGGGGGLLLSASPFAWAVEWIGWRETMTAVGIGTFVLSLAVWATLRDAPAGMPAPRQRGESLAETVRGLKIVLRDRRLYAFAGMVSMSMSAMMTVRALWVGSYLADVHGLDLVARGDVILAMSVAWLFSALIYGPLDRVFDTRRGVVSVGVLLLFVSLVLLAVFGGGPLWLVTAILILFGLTSSPSSPVMAHARAAFPDRYVGRVLTAANFFTWSGVFAMQMATGAIVEAFPVDAMERSPLIAYQAVFAFLAAALLVALYFYRRVPDVPPSRDHGDEVP